MSTIQRVNFAPVSDILPVTRRDFGMADPTLANPLNPAAFIDGEWVSLTTSYQIQRPMSIAAAGNLATVRSFPLWAEKGRYDVQANSGRNTPVIWLGEAEWDTRVFDASAVVGSGAAITTVMQPLKVASVSIGGVIYSGLVGSGGSADASPIIGYCTRLPANNGGQLRFRTGYRQ
jgi:hypothetical protein